MPTWIRPALLPLLVSLLLVAARPAAAAAPPCATQARAIARLETFEAWLPRFAPWVELWLGRLIRHALRVGSGRYADACVALNQVQVLGSHNSYHIQPVPSLIQIYLAFDSNAYQLEYTHRPLAEQLDLGVRQFELDVFHDPDGGLFSQPLGLEIRDGAGARIPALDAPGTKVLHIQDIDWDTRCQFFVECLHEIVAWSDAHPRHLPLFILIEAKQDTNPILVVIGGTLALEWDAQALDTLDAEIRSAVPADKLITPDDVRGDAASLEQAVLERGWPTLGEARGKILFGLDNGGSVRETYRAGRPSLEGRVLFTDGVPGEPDAAFVKANSPVGNEALIADLVTAGYVVRTRADADTLEARADDTSRRDIALASGAQYVSTDYEEPDPFDGQYVVEIPGGGPGRCNPVNAPPGCRDDALE